MQARQSSLDTLLARLAPRLGERLRTDSEALAAVAADESGLAPGSAGAVVWPLSTEETALIAREAAELSVPLVPRGAGTGKAGACIPQGGDVVVDFSRMKRLLELRPRDLLAVVQPGLVTGDLHAAAAEEGLMYPPSPGSWESCTLGGNIATNAGGARAVKYGCTQRYVWGLEVVLPGGDVVRMGRQSLKGVAGFDLTSLLVGSEGTLGLITEATLHVVSAPAAVETAWVTFADWQAPMRAADAILAARIVPRILEIMDRAALDAVRALSSFPIPEDAAAALLLESDGEPEYATAELLRMCELAVEHGAVDSAIARKERDREAMRRARRLVSSSLKEKYPYKISDDVAVPRSRMQEVVDRARDTAEQAGIALAAYGHLGDGNLHLNLLCRTQAEQEAGKGVRRRILGHTVALGGTITGEHGIGIAKRDELTIEQSAELIGLQRRLKQAFDPHGIMNPGKVLPRV